MTAGTPRLVATDLDGTIIHSDGTISSRTIATLRRIEAAGVQVVLITGRPPRTMGHIAAAFGYQGVAICSNGALIYDMHTEAVIEEHPIAPPELAEAARRLREAIPDIGLAVESATGLTADSRYQAGAWDSDVTLKRLPDAELFGQPAAKLLGRHQRLSNDELLALAGPAVAGVVTVCHSNGPRLVEASAIGVSKGSALAGIARREGISAAEVVAFGDMPNDLSMLAWAGHPYAPSNAHPDVLAAVNDVIPSNNDDGVAQTLDRLFPPA
jgi:Cof subfamily protein (haloacid dehalogenase superfamily)